MATYHRPDSLVELVPRLLDQCDEAGQVLGDTLRFRLIIVDNDPAGSGEASARGTGDPRVHYVIEESPGVSSARNRALEEARDCDFLAFIDDDETPHDRWLVHLLEAQQAHRAHVVSGPVRSVFDAPLDPWVEASDTYLRLHRAGLATGDPISSAATNNLLLDLRFVRSVGVRFDERFGLTGGEDSFFTRQLHRAGATMVWCAEAVVDDLVPVSRANRAYNLRRRYSLANSGVRVDILLERPGWPRARRRAISVVRGAGQIVVGTGLAAAGLVGRSLRMRAHGERRVVAGVASLAASLGSTSELYKRAGG